MHGSHGSLAYTLGYHFGFATGWRILSFEKFPKYGLYSIAQFTLRPGLSCDYHYHSESYSAGFCITLDSTLLDPHLSAQQKPPDSCALLFLFGSLRIATQHRHWRSVHPARGGREGISMITIVIQAPVLHGRAQSIPLNNN
jgi:hypothetical protein